jgi:hypothetical protein
MNTFTKFVTLAFGATHLSSKGMAQDTLLRGAVLVNGINFYIKISCSYAKHLISTLVGYILFQVGGHESFFSVSKAVEE